MRHRTGVGLLTALLLVCQAPVAAAATKSRPNFLHGLGTTIRGLVLEIPVTTFQAPVEEPPVMGTVIGLLAGVVRAFQTTASGLVEMYQGFHPWD